MFDFEVLELYYANSVAKLVSDDVTYGIAVMGSQLVSIAKTTHNGRSHCLFNFIQIDGGSGGSDETVTPE